MFLYWPSLDGPFLLDDQGNIKANFVSNFSWDGIYYAVTHNNSGILGRPISVLSLLFTGIVHGSETWGYKYHNLLLHLLNGLLVFWLLLRLFPHFYASRVTQEKILVISSATAALWLLHPLMVSTVLYAVQRMAQLSTFFTLIALLVYIFIRESAVEKKIQYYSLVLAFAICLILAVFSKEDGALICVFILMLETLVFQLNFKDRKEKRRILLFQLLFSIIPIILGVLYVLTHMDRFFNYTVRDFTLIERAMTELQVLVFYVKLVLLPVISDMSLFHDGWLPVKQLDVITVLCFLLWCGVLTLIAYCRKREPIISFGLAWFLVAHLLESTIFNLELVFEHRNYLAAVGLLIIPVYYLVTYFRERGTLLLIPLIFLLFTFMTHTRVGEWKNTEMIYTLAVEDHPESIRAQTAYASVLYARGELDAAIRHAAIAVELDETEYGSIILQILFLCGRGREEEINRQLEEATRRAGIYASTPYSLSALDKLAEQIQVKKCQEIQSEQVISLIRAARNQKNNLGKKKITGYLQRHEGIHHYFQGNMAQGYENMILAYENTDLISILVELIRIEAELGSLETAEHLLNIMEEDNRARLGSEQHMVEVARSIILQAKDEFEEAK